MRIKTFKCNARSLSFLNLFLLIALGLFGIGALNFTLNSDMNISIGIAYAISDNNSNNIVLKDLGSFLDSASRLNIVGVVDNNGHYPITDVIVGLNLKNNHSHTSLFPYNFTTSDIINDGTSAHTKITSTISAPTFARVIFPGTGAPFKIVLEKPGVSMASFGQPFISSYRQIDIPYYDVLKLNYTNMAVGNERALYGTVRNTAPFVVHNVTIYASVHDNNQTQIDSTKSKNIATIEPGQEIHFELIPNISVRSNVIYYSCAGVDLDAPITTLATPDGGFVAYDLQALAKIIDLKYNSSSDSIAFGVDHYNPDGGSITMKLPQMYDNQKISVLLDGKLANDTKITTDGKTTKMDIFIPPEEHQLQILGVAHTTA